MKKIVLVAFIILSLALTACSSNTDRKSAKMVADNYCQMLLDKTRSIERIEYTGNYSENEGIFTFEYKVVYTTATRKGLVRVYEDSSGNFKVIRMDMID